MNIVEQQRMLGEFLGIIGRCGDDDCDIHVARDLAEMSREEALRLIQPRMSIEES